MLLETCCASSFSAGSWVGWRLQPRDFLLVVVAFERYYATLYPFQRLRGGRLSWLVPILWIMAIQLLLHSLEVSVYDVESQGCVANFPDYTTVQAYKLTWSFCNSVLPMCIMGYLYTRVILCPRNRVFVPGYFQQSASQSTNKETKILITVFIIYVTCWTPDTPAAVLCWLSPVIPRGYASVHHLTAISALLNSSLNPLSAPFIVKSSGRISLHSGLSVIASSCHLSNRGNSWRSTKSIGWKFKMNY